MDTRIEWKAGNRWDIITDDDAEQVIGHVHEGRDRPADFTIRRSEADPSLLADLRERRYASLDAVAAAISAHLDGRCWIT